MPPDEDRQPWTMRGLLESTKTPFAVAGYGPRATIFSQGDPCDSVMHIESGRVRLVVTAPSGKEGIVGLLGTGAFLGEEVIGGHAARRQTAITMTATDVLVVAKAQMLRLVGTQPAFAEEFIARLLERNTRLEADLTCQLLHSCEERLTRTLLVLGGCDERRPCRCVLPHVSQEIIAEMVGTTRSRVNAFMGKFKRLGFIEEDGGVLEINPSGLQVVQACPSSAPHRGVVPGAHPNVPQPAVTVGRR